MEKILTLKEREKLVQRHRTEHYKRICDHIQAVFLRDDGYNYSEIGRTLLLDDETIRSYIEAYLKHLKLNPENLSSKGNLDQCETQGLTEHISEITYLYVKDICIYFKKTFKKKYTVIGMIKWLHANGFCYKKPHALSAKVNKEQQKKFIQHYHQLKANLGSKEPICFIDSIHPHYQSYLK